MAELIRKIEEADLPKIRAMIKEVFDFDDYKDIVRLGGMTNHSYKVTLENDEIYLMRLPGEGTEEMLNRDDERKSTELACELGIDAPLIYFNSDGRKVMKFIDNPKEINEETMKRKDIIDQAAAIFHRLHTCDKDTGVRFEVFEMCDSYEKLIIDKNVKLYDDYYDVKDMVMNIKAEIDSKGKAEKVPCHNDSLIGNWVLDENDKLWLIDWEYSGMNEAMWDLSCLSIEMGYNNQEDDYLLERYYNRKVSTDEKKRFVGAKTYVDLLWTLWGLTRVPYDGDFMQEYADGRYSRLKKNILTYNQLS